MGKWMLATPGGTAGPCLRDRRFGGLAALVGALALATSASAQQASERVDLPARGDVPVHPIALVQLAAARNAEALAAGLQAEVAGHLYQAERALYDPVVFSRARIDDINRPRNEDDPLALFGVGEDLSEEIHTLESGVRQRLPWGGEGLLSYQWRERESSVLSEGNEFTGLMTLTLRQPLLRGRGRDAMEADLRVVELERDIDLARYRERLLQTAGEAINGYWQLYRAVEGRGIRERSLENVRQLQEDVERRVEGGFAPSTDMLEARIAVSSRRADLTRASRQVAEAQSRLRTLLNLDAVDGRDLSFVPEVSPDLSGELELTLDERLQLALDVWPQFQIANLRHQQEMVRLGFASNQRLPTLDMEVGFNLNSVGNESEPGLYRDERSILNAMQFNHKSGWYAALEFEMPIGNRQGRERYAAQEVRAHQSALEIGALRNSLGHDLQTRWNQFQSAHQEVRELAEDARLREQLLEAEQAQYRLGRSRLSQVFDREDELNESRQRLLDSATRLELARLALYLADGSLLELFGVAVESEQL